MSLPGNAYEQAFTNDSPKSIVSLLSTRLKGSESVASSLADYFEERSLIETEYAKKLSKLSPRVANAEDTQALQELITAIEAELNASVKQHSQFATKLDKTVSESLRAASRAGENQLKTYAQDAMAIANEHDSISAKVKKATSGSGGFSLSSKSKQEKLANNQDDLSTALASWYSVAPNYLRAVQAADKARLEGIKENLAKFETLVSDLGRERMETAERGLLSVLGWEAEDDMQSFMLKRGARLPARQAANNAPTIAPITPTPQKPQSETALNRRHSNASPSIRSNVSSHRDSVSAKQSSSGGGFLSSLSSKIKPSMNRNRSSSYGNLEAPPSSSNRITPSNSMLLNAEKSAGHSQDLTDSTTDETPLAAAARPAPISTNMDLLTPDHPPRSASLRDDANSVDAETPPVTNEKQQPEIELLAPNASTTSYHAPEPIAVPQPASASTSKEKRRESFLPFGLGRRSSNAKPSTSAPAMANQASSSTTNRKITEEPITEQPAEQMQDDTKQSNPFGDDSFGQEQSLIQPAFTQSSNAPTVDQEGYSIPPANYQAEPWANTNIMDDKHESTPRLNMDIAQQPLQPVHTESAEDRDAAFANVQSTLLSAVGQPASIGRRGTTRGRRDVRSAVYQPALPVSNDDVPLSQLASSSLPPVITQPSETTSPSSITSPGSFLAARTNGRTGSILSTTSSADVASSPASNIFADPHGSGLRANIVETVSVLFKQGSAPRVQVTGEISFMLKGTHEPFAVRIAQPSLLEKIIPNNSILTPRQPGEFSVDSHALGSTAAPTVILKYHVQLDADQVMNYLPVNVSSQWKCEADRTLLLVNYSSNPACLFTSASSSSPFEEAPTIKDFSLLVPITSRNVSNVQSKPTAIYSAEKKRLLWKLDDLSLNDHTPHKALVRFQVQDQSQPQPISVKWKIQGSLISKIDLQVVDGSSGVKHIEELVQSTQSGKYLIA